MQLFAIFGVRDDQRGGIVELAETRYSVPNVYSIPNGLFIASDGETTQEVCSKLGIGGTENGMRGFNGVVVMVNYYWGYHDKELWEWMVARSSNGK